MVTDTPTDQIKRELLSALDRMRRDLDRVELLTAALEAFSRPVPRYEPAFHHMHKAMRGVHQLDSEGTRS